MSPDLELYLDSAKLDEVRGAHATGKLAGLTINPSLALKAIGRDGDYAGHVRRIFDIVGHECHKSYQTAGKTSDGMLAAAYRLVDAFGQYGGLGIKVGVLIAAPDEKHLAREGLKTIRALAGQGILVNATTVQRPEHMALAAYLGAGLISPFLGRTDDLIRTNMGLAPDTNFKKSDYFPADGIRPYSDGYGNTSGVQMMARGIYALRFLKRPHRARILAASVRNEKQSQEAYASGADIITSPSGVFADISRTDFYWPPRSTPVFGDIAREDVERWINTYENGTDAEVYELLYHPKTIEGFLLFAADGDALASFRQMISWNTITRSQ